MPLRLTKAGDPQVGHFMTSLMVVDEVPRFWGQRLHTNGSEEYSPRFRRTLLERSGSPRNMFSGESIRPPPVGRFGAGRTVFSLLIFYLNPVPFILLHIAKETCIIETGVKGAYSGFYLFWWFLRS